MLNKISSTACVLLILSVIASASSQTNSGKSASGSISGKVTLKNKGVAGIIVFAHEQNVSGGKSSSYRGTTDQTGSYRITNVPAGTYVLNPVAPSLALENELMNNSVVVLEGETVENINFQMVPGAVITGKITDADGRPLIEESVTLTPIDSTIIEHRLEGNLHTDDRGIYRAYGLRQGKYKVSVGQEATFPGSARRSYRKTFYPSVTDAEKAKAIEVTEGSETKDIDIVVGRPLQTFQISGRIVDVETGKPLTNTKYGMNQNIDENSSYSVVGRTFSNSNGEFTSENIAPGKYAVFIVPEESGFRGDSVSLEVIDRDITDLLIKAGKASSLSGVVVFEGAEGAAPAVNLRELYINAWVESTKMRFNTNNSVPVNADGTFRISGLRKGLTHFGLASRSDDAKQIALVRVERDGIVQPDGVTLRDGEQVTGLRLVAKYLTGAIHGQVKVEGEELLQDSRLSVWITAVDDSRPGSRFTAVNSSPQVDSRRRFVVTGLAAGTYEVNVAVFDPRRADTSKMFKQQVTVADNAVSEVTITIKTKP